MLFSVQKRSRTLPQGIEGEIYAIRFGTGRRKDLNNTVRQICNSRYIETADVALARLSTDSITPGLIEEVGEISGIRELVFSDIGKTVVKRGRTTIKTRGMVDAVNCVIHVEGDTIRRNSFRLKAMDEKGYSDGGDSGSPVVLMDTNELVGIHFAGLGKPYHMYGWASDIVRTFSAFNVELLDNK